MWVSEFKPQYHTYKKKLSQTSKISLFAFFFFLLQNQKIGGQNSPAGRLRPVGQSRRWERVREGEYGVNTVHRCKNDTCWNYSKNGGRRGKRRAVEGVNSSMIYLIHCTNFHKYHNVPPTSTQKIIFYWKTFLAI
jgi:hypothetical protein